MGDPTEAWEQRLARPGASEVYLHIPFCRRKCSYCDFPSWATRRDDPVMGAYTMALVTQLGEAVRTGVLEDVTTGYIGGGTPSMLPTSDLAQLVSTVSSLGRSGGLLELTCEANPESLGDEVINALMTSGATRVSIGVQSLDNGELKELGRIHDGKTALDRVRSAAECGLDVSCDLMCAIPRQTNETWARTLGDVVASGAGHVSVYPLAVEDGTPMARRCDAGELPYPSEDDEAARMQLAREILEEGGFARYEVASYALPGKSCMHNIGYWTGAPYLGLGTGAASMLTREGYDRLRAAMPQLPDLPDETRRVRMTVVSSAREVVASPGLAHLAVDLELLSGKQAAAEDLMLGARLVNGISPGCLTHARKLLGKDRVDEALRIVMREGLAEMGPSGGVRPTEHGWLMGNVLYGALWDLSEGTIEQRKVRS